MPKAQPDAVTKRGGKKNKIEHAIPEIRDMVDQLLFDGESSYAICYKIREGWPDFTDVTPRALMKNIDTYKKSQPCLDRLARLEEVKAQLTVQRFDKKVDVLKDMQWAASTQRERVEKAMEKEKLAPLPLKSVSEEINNYKGLLVELGKMEMAVGIIQPAPKKVSGVMEGPNGKPTKFSWTEEQDTLVAAMGTNE